MFPTPKRQDRTSCIACRERDAVLWFPGGQRTCLTCWNFTRIAIEGTAGAVE